MKKLSNQGWGLAMMVVLMSILLIFFAIAIYFIYLFYNNFANKDLLIKPNYSITRSV